MLAPDDAFALVSAADRLPLQAYCWRAGGALQGVVVIAHGAAEHALRYGRFARALTAAGFQVYALDHRGHGRSPGPQGFGDLGEAGWPGLVADLAQLIGHARALHPDLPVALFGHSMGSFAAQQYCPEHSREIAAVVLSGSAAMRGSEEAQAAGVARFAPNTAFEPARTPYDWLSRDPAEVDAYIADPLCGFEGENGRRLLEHRERWRRQDVQALASIRPDLPVLLVAGDADPINQKLEALQLLETRWRDAGVRRIDTRYYAGGRHEMLNELNRDEVTRDIVRWLSEALG